MALTSLSGTPKENLIISLSAVLCADCGVEVTAETLQAVVDASGNTIAPYWAPLFAAYAGKAGNLNGFMAAPGAAAAAAPAAGATAAAPAAAVEEKKPVVEEEVDLGGGMDMFGGGEEGGAY